MALTKLRIALGILLGLLISLSLGCGLKSPPEPYLRLAPKPVKSLSVRPVTDGVQVSFGLPPAEKPSRAIAEVRVNYVYRAIDAKLPCSKCPVELTKSRAFTLKEDQTSGEFAFIDKEVPLDMMAIYQIVLKDGAGRESTPSGLAWAPRLAAPAQVTGLKAEAGDGLVTITWQPLTTLVGGRKLNDLSGYRVFRRAKKGETLLNHEGITQTSYTDRAVVNGQTYAYRVVAQRTNVKHTLSGAPSEWVEAMPQDQSPPTPPGELVAVSTPNGIFLNFTAVTADDLAGYLVFRAEGGSAAWSQLNAKPQVENGYVDKDVQAGVTYRYRVVAVDQKGNASEPSKVTEVLHEP
jgi:hypothetical protein